MAREVFVDTTGWFPAVIRSHPLHDRMASALRRGVATGARIVTTNLIVAETHVLLLRRDRRETALEFVRTVYEPPNLVVRSSESLEKWAVEDWLDPYEDQDFSFTDAVSFAVMTERGVDEAITLDAHFATAGFRMVG